MNADQLERLLRIVLDSHQLLEERATRASEALEASLRREEVKSNRGWERESAAYREEIGRLRDLIRRAIGEIGSREIAASIREEAGL